MRSKSSILYDRDGQMVCVLCGPKDDKIAQLENTIKILEENIKRKKYKVNLLREENSKLRTKNEEQKGRISHLEEDNVKSNLLSLIIIEGLTVKAEKFNQQTYLEKMVL